MHGIVRLAAGRLTLASVVGLAAALAVAAFTVWALAALANGMAEEKLRAFDRGVLTWVGDNSPAWLDGPMRAVTTLGYYWVVLPLAGLAAAGFYLKGDRLPALFLILASTGSMMLTTTLKTVFGRARPELFDSGYSASFYSFPSGHATVAIGFYGVLALLLAYRLRGWRRWCTAIAGVVLVLSIGFSRLYFGVHYPTDVLAGYLAASSWITSLGVAYGIWRALADGKSRSLGSWGSR